MASICTSNYPNFHFLCRNNPNPSSILHHLLLTPSCVSFSRCGGLRLCHCAAVKTSSGDNAELIRKPVISTELETEEDEVAKKSGDGEGWVDWEDQILEDTVPLVGFVRMILHSGKVFKEIGQLGKSPGKTETFEATMMYITSEHDMGYWIGIHFGQMSKLFDPKEWINLRTNCDNTDSFLDKEIITLGTIRGKVAPMFATSPLLMRDDMH
ncbi:hypothetical protein RND71_031570 [Anisodus tanguticus]|uniref:Uncharacterized protein n=1 Tax=Anisodus tanguticus TaxID=243964 RepID=A0AAE1RAZ8_9SOLA|nr:hypothetical protein RND71_031570 [Anisodus tanguticus]